MSTRTLAQGEERIIYQNHTGPTQGETEAVLVHYTILNLGPGDLEVDGGITTTLKDDETIGIVAEHQIRLKALDATTVQYHFDAMTDRFTRAVS